MSNGFRPVFTTTHRITNELTRIERARGFLEAAALSEQWVREMGRRALLLEAHHTTHIEGTRLTLDQSRRLLEGSPVADTDPEDARELLNFKRLFTISEYYDRDRPAFYRAIQTVRQSGMDLTAWLEYFVEGLATQLAEVRTRGERAIRRDVLIKKRGLSDRQAKALSRIVEYGSLTIKDFERLCPDVNRRSLQRDIRAMIEQGIVEEEATSPTDPGKRYVFDEECADC